MLKSPQTLALVTVWLSALSGNASAQQPPSCPAQSSEYTFPVETISASQTDTLVFPSNFKMMPCETLMVTLTAKYESKPNPLCNFGVQPNVSLSWKILNSSASGGQELTSNTGVNCPNNSCSTELPLVGVAAGRPLPGTRGAPGLADQIQLITGPASFNWCAAEPLTYTVRLNKQPRAGYNTGGDSFSNASTISVGTPQYGSIHKFETGQFYKISVDAAQMIFIKGQVTGPSQGTNFRVDLHDANQAFVKRLVDFYAASPPGGPIQPTTIPVIPANTYINTAGSSRDFYLKVYLLPTSNPALAFDITVATPKLTGPTSLVRGSTGAFNVEDAPGLTFSSWNYEVTYPTGWTPINRTTDVNAQSWSGPIVVSGTAKVTVGLGTNTVVLEKHVDVQPRSWQPFPPKLPVKVQNGATTCPGSTIQFADPLTGAPGVGGTRHCLGYDVLPYLAFVPAGGPNAAVKWLTDITDTTTAFWGMHSTVEDPTSTWWLANCGNFVPAPGNSCVNRQGTGFILAETFRAGLERHEVGLINSHQRKYADEMSRMDRNLRLNAESIVREPSAHMGIFNLFVHDILDNLRDQIILAMNSYEPCSQQCDDTCTDFLGFGNVNPIVACPVPNLLAPAAYLPFLMKGQLR